MTPIDAPQEPYAPGDILAQLPDASCKIVVGGTTFWLGAESCTCYAGAMFVDRVTGGRLTPDGCTIRRLTGDIIDGTTLPQVAKVIRNHYGIAVTEYVGSNVCKPSFLARQIRAGRPAIVQGNTAAYIGTEAQVTAGDVNHAEMWPAVRGGTLDYPREVLVYDSCADGRMRPYHVDNGPTWISWTLALRFAAYLRPNGPGTPRLGPGKIYCGIGPDTEPHVSLVKGAHQADPFPDRVRAAKKGKRSTPIHSRPGGTSTVTRSVVNGTLLRLYQIRDGWGANDDGTEWVLLRNTSHVGGVS